MRHFFLEPTAEFLPAPGDTVALDPDESHHLFTVLRGGRQTVLHLVDGQGRRLTGQAVGKDGKRALVRVETVTLDERENALPHLVLACAVVKGKRFEWALEKAVELGAHRIIPLRCANGVIDPREGKRSRWVTLLKSALKQCGRSWLPTLEAPQTLSAALDAGSDQINLFGAVPGECPAAEVPTWDTLLSAKPTPLPAALGVFVGPEGGWTTAEWELLASRAQPVRLGPHILRTETAAAAGLTALQTLRQAWQDRT